MPGALRNARKEYMEKRIPGAHFFPVDEVADTSNPLPHMLPSPQVFAEFMGKCGVSERDTVVLYDSLGIFNSPRVWYTLKVFGHQDVRILSGGLPTWESLDFPLDTSLPAKSARVDVDYIPTFNPSLVADLDFVKRVIDEQSHIIIDARSADRFYGRVPEPREGLRSGHIPGSYNLPFNHLQTADAVFVTAEVVERELSVLGISLEHETKPFLVSCGTGVTAAHLFIGLLLCGVPFSRIVLYDGSWTEYGRTDVGTLIA
eukprot:GCRY01002955.1.p1 GENE.GCRY01002955.1~~GCRY01002955.1.p1  ORF type:complete len:282 (-),score=42.56 GCRY01002955.1:223-999(-)